jgi:hypothetical protein
MPSQAAFARHRGVSRNRISVWKRRGLIIYDAEGGVDFEKSDQAIADHGGNLAGLPKTGNAKASVIPNDACADIETLEEAAARIVIDEGALWSKAEAERVKENYAAKLRQLEYDRESGLVAEIDDVVIAVATELSLVRNKLLNIGSRVAPRIAVMNSAEAIKAMIDAEVVLALQELTLDQPDVGDMATARAAMQVRFGPADFAERAS